MNRKSNMQAVVVCALGLVGCVFICACGQGLQDHESTSSLDQELSAAAPLPPGFTGAHGPPGPPGFAPPLPDGGFFGPLPAGLVLTGRLPSYPSPPGLSGPFPETGGAVPAVGIQTQPAANNAPVAPSFAQALLDG